MDLKEAFLSLPETFIITDLYWYILEYNRTDPFPTLCRGRKISDYMSDCQRALKDEYVVGSRIYQRTVSEVREGRAHLGYIVSLVDITERKRLIEESRKANQELELLVHQQLRANEELKEYARQTEILSAYNEQLRIARDIHDDAGHSITDLHIISQMCLKLKDQDLEQFQDLAEKGIEICEKAVQEKKQRSYDTIREWLEVFQRASPLEIEMILIGSETSFVRSRQEVVQRICKEALHNTLSHSLGDRLMIEMKMEKNHLSLRVMDNGSFHGHFEKGFGLLSMEDYVHASNGKVRFHAVQGEGFGIIAEWEG